MKIDLHRVSLILLYALTVAAIGYTAWSGWGYYGLPLTERPRHDLHSSYKPSGLFGQGLGVIGSFLMIVMLLYSVRKRFRFAQRWGNIRFWLNYHIWMGVTGPLLIIFHTGFKIGGIIAVSFWSMIAVALSGVLGRYLYVQIPRSLNGTEISEADLFRHEQELLNSLHGAVRLDEQALNRLVITGTGGAAVASAGWGSVWSWIVGDLLLPMRLSTIRRELVATAGIDMATAGSLTGIMRKLSLLRRRRMFLGTAHKLLHHWHLIHKPFAIVMIVIMLVHIAVAWTFGYTWIF